jgi:predicted metal-dependent peptidase
MLRKVVPLILISIRIMHLHQQVLEEVTKTSIALLLKEPFYAHFFACLNKEVVDPPSPLETLAVGLKYKNFVLYINSSFWTKVLIEPQHRYGVLKHEVLHLVFKHLLVDEPHVDRHLLNIAMDLVVNQYIDRAQLPKESIFLETFTELNLEVNQTYFYYYDALKQLAADEKNQSQAAQNLRNITRQSHGLERHELWGEISSQDNLEKGVLEAQIENLIRISHQKTPIKSWSNMPGGVQEYLKNILFKPQPLVQWRMVMQLFTESSKRTFIKNTLKRVSKRFGTVPGIKIKRRQRLLVAIDTSGSVGIHDIELFFSEIYHLWRTGSDIDVIECDTAIQPPYAYKGVPPKYITGRGGTYFDPPIEYGNKHEYDGLVYFTDGYAAVPTIAARFPLLWVITETGLSPNDPTFAALPGRKAKIG